MEFTEWLKVGMENGWCGPSVCYTHDGIPTSMDEEDVADADGEYPCIHIIRLYEDLFVKAGVEENHSPSVWRGLGY